MKRPLSYNKSGPTLCLQYPDKVLLANRFCVNITRLGVWVGAVFAPLPRSCLLAGPSGLQPPCRRRPKWNGFKLWTFDCVCMCVCAWTLSSSGPDWSISQNPRGTVTLAHPIWCLCESLIYRPQNKRWDHVWIGFKNKEKNNLLRLSGLCKSKVYLLLTSKFSLYLKKKERKAALFVSLLHLSFI